MENVHDELNKVTYRVACKAVNSALNSRVSEKEQFCIAIIVLISISILIGRLVNILKKLRILPHLMKSFIIIKMR